jgi:AcrR family transcriptional regulator
VVTIDKTLKRTQRPSSSRDRLRQSAKALFAQRGFDGTTTAAICRMAGTSQSQLIKHFTDKEGLLDAILQHGWEQINPALRLATESVDSPSRQLSILTNMMLGFLEKDLELRTLLLLEGRRISGSGAKVTLAPGFLEFTKIADGILQKLVSSGEFTPKVHPQAFRSAMMGAIEGMLRDHMLGRSSRFPASYSQADMEIIISAFFSACLSGGK